MSGFAAESSPEVDRQRSEVVAKQLQEKLLTKVIFWTYQMQGILIVGKIYSRQTYQYVQTAQLFSLNNGFINSPEHQ